MLANTLPEGGGFTRRQDDKIIYRYANILLVCQFLVGFVLSKVSDYFLLPTHVSVDCRTMNQGASIPSTDFQILKQERGLGLGN